MLALRRKSVIRAALVCSGFLLFLPESADAQPLAVDGHFAHKDNEWNISGIDCMGQPGDPIRTCLVVDDELTDAEFATLEPRRFVVANRVQLFAETNQPILGSAPDATVHCSGGKRSGEMDGEGVAYSAPDFYVVGSHGCSRKKGRYHPETFVLARVQVAEDGTLQGIERTYRLGDALLRTNRVKEFFGKDLSPELEAANVEALVVKDGRVIVGLRAPSVDGKAFLVSVPVNALFGDAPLPDKLSPTEVLLGEGRGFRDLEALPDGGFLALIGPSQETAGGYSLQPLTDDLKLQGEPKWLPAWADPDASPEAIELLGNEGGVSRVLIVSDSAQDGGPVVVDFN